MSNAIPAYRCIECTLMRCFGPLLMCDECMARANAAVTTTVPPAVCKLPGHPFACGCYYAQQIAP